MPLEGYWHIGTRQKPVVEGWLCFVVTYIAILGVVLLGFHGSCVQPSCDIDNCCDERALRGVMGNK